MKVFSVLLISIYFLLSAGQAEGQSFNSGRNRKTFKGLRATYPHHGFGFKLGDPFAATYKFYGSENFSFALDFGSPAKNLYNRYFREKFFEYAVSDTFKTSNASLRYLSHRVKRDVVGEAKFLYHINGRQFSPGVAFYVGLGWEWRDTHILYSYLYNNSHIENATGEFPRRRLTMGPQVIAGIEYGGFKFPVSAFMEIEYFRDVQVDPGWSRFEGGVGFRYRF